MKFFKKILGFFFVIIVCLFIFSGNSFAEGLSIKDKRTNEAIEKLLNNSRNEKTIIEYFGSKDAFIEHFKNNYDYINDIRGTSYMRQIAELNDHKKRNEGNQNNNEQGNSLNNGSNGKKLVNIKDFIEEGDDDFILEIMFGTSDKEKLKNAGFLPEQGTGLYDFMLKLYASLFIFFTIVGGAIIIFFIFFIISNAKGVLGGKRDQNKFGKFEEYIIGFIVVILVLFGGIRLYMLILKSSIKSIEDDIERVKNHTSYSIEYKKDNFIS